MPQNIQIQQFLFCFVVFSRKSVRFVKVCWEKIITGYIMDGMLESFLGLFLVSATKL